MNKKSGFLPNQKKENSVPGDRVVPLLGKETTRPGAGSAEDPGSGLLDPMGRARNSRASLISCGEKRGLFTVCG